MLRAKRTFNMINSDNNQPNTAKLLFRLSETLSHGRIAGDKILLKTYGNVMTMIERDRGYEIVHKCGSLPELMQHIENSEPVITARRHSTLHTDDAKSLCVMFDCEDRVGVKYVRGLFEKTGDEGVDFLMVSLEGATPFLRKEVDPTRVEFWMFKELLYNPCDHALVPKHTRLTDEEWDKLSSTGCTLRTQLPVLLQTDIICRWNRFRPNDVICIRRIGIAHESGNYYRRVAVVV